VCLLSELVASRWWRCRHGQQRQQARQDPRKELRFPSQTKDIPERALQLINCDNEPPQSSLSVARSRTQLVTEATSKTTRKGRGWSLSFPGRCNSCSRDSDGPPRFLGLVSPLTSQKLLCRTCPPRIKDLLHDDTTKLRISSSEMNEEFRLRSPHCRRHGTHNH
jgi:hypothetical protein